MEIIKLDFKKTTSEINSASYGNIDLADSENLEKISKYIIPVIEKNSGWDTENVTSDEFAKDPAKFQDALNATLFSNVHLALDDEGKPAGLIEYLEETLDSPLSAERMNNLKDLISNKSSWSKLIELKVISNELVEEFVPKLSEFFKNKKIYSEIGVVTRKDLQGKKSGVAEKLYSILNNGIIFGWTNNPALVSQWRKNFGNVIYFPLLNEEFKSLEYIASLAVLYADLLTYDPKRWVEFEFGALNSPYFVSSRGDYYLDLSKKLASSGKITEFDLKRIEYCLAKDSVQGAIFAFN